MTNNDENIKNKIDKINSLHMDILNFNLNNQNQIYSDFLELKKEIFSKFEDIDNKMKFLYNRINELDNKIKFINNFNYQKESVEEIYNSVNNNNENINNIYSQIKQLQLSINEIKIKNDNYEFKIDQLNNFDKITNYDEDIKLNKKCLPFI